ncbi:hypothetical protein LshimejAT787_0705380 [Lyophyllum shimeji]|uniref:Uncharacterized protein n=1 Tax=Lyophyllum shimeji TaxID=47721 RepID=A0A9P3UNU4_LYOSH|nr:hypothetical protein LshimejAT787_0705380 [Lyophyllum shimeji]
MFAAYGLVGIPEQRVAKYDTPTTTLFLIPYLSCEDLREAALIVINGKATRNILRTFMSSFATAARMSPQGVASIAMGITKDGVSVERAGVEAPNSRTPTASKETKLVMHRLTSRLSSGNKRPLCSSPLAGPALSNPSVVGLEIDNFIDEELPLVLSSPSTAVPRRKKPAEGTVRFSTLRFRTVLIHRRM